MQTYKLQLGDSIKSPVLLEQRTGVPFTTSKPLQQEFPYNGQSMYKGGYDMERAKMDGIVGKSVGKDGVWLKDKDHPTAWKELLQTTLNLKLNKQVGFPILNENGRLQYINKNLQGGIIKAQSGVVLTNTTKESSLGRYPVFNNLGVFTGDKKINWLNTPITKQVNIPQSEADRINKVLPTIRDFNNDFIKTGYNENQSAGMLGNIFMESGFNPAINQNGGGPGFGIGQWEKQNPRFKNLKELANKYKKPITDENVQKEYLLTELNSPKREYIENAWGGKGRKEKFLQSKSIEDSATNFSKLFLRPGNPHLEKRIQYSNYIHDRLTE